MISEIIYQMISETDEVNKSLFLDLIKYFPPMHVARQIHLILIPVSIFPDLSKKNEEKKPKSVKTSF